MSDISITPTPVTPEGTPIGKIEANKPTKLFPLLRYFSLISLVCILIVAVLLGLMSRKLSVDNLIKNTEQNNIALAQVLANTMSTELESFIPTATQLNKKQLSSNPKVKKIHALFASKIAGVPILKIKIFNPKGMTLYSTDESQIGIQKK